MPPQLTRRGLGLGLALGAAGCASTAQTQTTPAPALHQRLAPLARLVGHWRGAGQGQPGTSTVERSYLPVLGGMFLEVRNRSVYAPQAANPEGETHDDLGFYSLDRAGQRIVFRQFHVEGFVNTYAAPAPANLDAPFAMITEAIENIPAGFRGRETLSFAGPDTLEEVFEIAEPGGEFELYSRNRLSRV